MRAGQLLRQSGQTSLAIANSRKAYELRDRVSQRDKYYISAQYYTNVTGEVEKATEQYELWTQNYPRDAIPYTNVGVGYSTEGQYEKSAAQTREALRSIRIMSLSTQTWGRFTSL